MQRKPPCGCCPRAAAAPALRRGKPSVLQRQTVTGPVAGQHGSSSGNAGPPDLLTLGLPSCSSPTPKDRIQSTDAPFPPNMLQGVHTHLCVCKDPPYSTGWAHALLCTPLPELASQLSGLHWTWGSPPAPSSMSPSSAPSQDKATLASPCCSTQEVRGTKGCTQLGCSLPHSSCCCQPPMEPPGLLLACQRQNHRGPLGEAGDSLVIPVPLGGLS